MSSASQGGRGRSRSASGAPRVWWQSSSTNGNFLRWRSLSRPGSLGAWQVRLQGRGSNRHHLLQRGVSLLQEPGAGGESGALTPWNPPRLAAWVRACLQPRSCAAFHSMGLPGSQQPRSLLQARMPVSCHLEPSLAQGWRETWVQVTSNLSIHRGSKCQAREGLGAGREARAGLLPGSRRGDVSGARPRKAEVRALPSGPVSAVRRTNVGHQCQPHLPFQTFQTLEK